MARLALHKTRVTPSIILDKKEGLIEFSGRSIPENSHMFYSPIFKWVDQYIKDPVDRTTINLKFEYFDSSSSRCLAEIFRKLEVMVQKGKQLNVNWFYEEDDESMMRTGEDYCELTGIPFKMVAVPEFD